MKFDIFKLIPQFAKRSVKTVKREAPTIFVVLGITGGAVAAVIACDKSRKLDSLLDAHKERVNDICAKTQDNPSEQKKALCKEYAKTGGELTILYMPAIGLGALSIGSILWGHNLLRKRTIALAAAYTTLDQSFADYRERVIERYGEDVDTELKLNAHYEEMPILDEDGNATERTEKRLVLDGEPTGYMRIFSPQYSDAAEGNIEYDLFFLRSQERAWNNVLRARLSKNVYFSEVLLQLGFKNAETGLATGWIYDKSKDGVGDNYIDFGIQVAWRKNPDEPSGYERVILLNFNVDGAITKRLKTMGLIDE